MKMMTATICLMFSLWAFADIEYTPEDKAPTVAEVQNYRACFEEVERAGCKLPKEDQKEFRTCMSQNFTSLSSNCQKMLSKLYGK